VAALVQSSTFGENCNAPCSGVSAIAEHLVIFFYVFYCIFNCRPLCAQETERWMGEMSEYHNVEPSQRVASSL